MIKIASLLLLFGVIVNPCFSKPSSDTKYISQELVDTSILRAFVILNASADMAGVGFRHRESLEQARNIARSLKQKAKGDPNERYVLWKVGELEAQIYLEERDLVLQQMQKRQLTINELVDKYNSEVGKWRPDFGTLYRIHKNMDQVDAGKAGELADSYNKRKNAISREAIYFLEKALDAGNAEEARKELGYCLRNHLYLNISETSYKRLETRVEGLYYALEAKPAIKSAIVSAHRLLDMKKINESRKTLDSAANKLSVIKKNLPERDETELSSLLKRATRRLGTLEDSLVNVNIAILRSSGVDAADRYLQTVLRPYGVSRDKAASVDRMIIGVKSPEKSAMSSEISSLDTENDVADGSGLDDVISVAKRKARIKMDSLQTIENVRLEKEQREQARLDSIAEVQQAAREVALRMVRLKVDSLVMHIYNLIEKSDIASATKILGREASFLQKNMPYDDYSMLKNTVEQFNSYQLETTAVVTNTHSSTTNTMQLSAAPPSPSPYDVKANRDRAHDEIMGIYTLLENNEIDRAYRRFQTNKKPLRKYLEPEAYNMLETTVVQAYQYYFTKK